MLTDRTASPPAWTPGHRFQVRRPHACEVESPLDDRGAKREYRIGFQLPNP